MNKSEQYLQDLQSRFLEMQVAYTAAYQQLWNSRFEEPEAVISKAAFLRSKVLGFIVDCGTTKLQPR